MEQHNNLEQCQCILEGPEDDFIGIETCCPNTIINNKILLFLILHCIFIYVLNTSEWQTLKKK